jgi:septal ring factor EnvC (AmiA/AmiB activator)
MHIRALVHITLLCLLALPAAGYGQDASTDGSRELERIKREMGEQRKALKRVDRKERSVLVDLDRIDRDIASGEAAVREQQQVLDRGESTLREIEGAAGTITREIGGLRTAYGARLRALYKMRHGLSELVLGANSPGSLVKQFKYLAMIAERDRVLIRDYGDALSRLTQQQKDIAARRIELLGQRRAVLDRRNELEGAKRKKALLLAGVRQKKSVYEQTLRELEESSASLWALIKRDEADRRTQSGQEAPAPPSRSVDTRERLPWPLGGKVLSPFGMQRHPQFGTMIFRRGIDIEAREGDDVRAVESGQVAFADWYKGYGRLVIVDHGNGLYSLYGNLSRLGFAKGDRVGRGQVIGQAGASGGLKSGALYFELRKNGEAQDPFLWLAKR